jgi:tRNA-2-methylthio-N6-dimethylallyladenosine synthase
MTGRTRTDHIVVFDGNERLAGQTMMVDIHEASPFTLYGSVVTGEQVGAECRAPEVAATPRRIGLPLV